MRGYANSVALRFVGHASFADLEHVGRRSGVVRHTPVRAFRTPGTVLIGINFGRESDWLRNIQAAGRCRIRLGDERLELGAPTIVPLAQVARRIPWPFRFALRYLVRTRECAELPIISSAHR